MSRLITIFFLIPVLALAQYRPKSHIEYSEAYTLSSRTLLVGETLKEVNHIAIQTFLQSDSRFELAGIDLRLVDSVKSPAGWHFNYQQNYKGVKVYGAGLKANVDNNGRIRSIVDHTVRIPNKLSSDFPPVDLLSAEYSTELRELIYFWNMERLNPCLWMNVKGDILVNYGMIVNAAGVILYRQDLNRYMFSDSVVTAKVFLPDPLTTGGQTYGGAYSDIGDADNTELNAERFDVTMVVDFANDTFRLTSPLIKIQDFSPPTTTVATSLVPNFDFTRSQKGFEDVNCFYHLTTFQNYMQSLGFNLVTWQLGADAHALSGADNSLFSYPNLYFGDGCVDDAEDADVIIHEYGHAITTSAAPNTWDGNERKALDEGAGDYLATSYSRSLNSFNWELMFSWDGHNACWAGRTAATTKQYPAGLNGDIHDDGEIWSSTLMEIWEVLGRETTDQIFLQSLYSYAKFITMTDAAYMFLDADSMLNGGANYVASYYWFEKRGILPSLPFFSGTDGNGAMASCNGVCDASAVVIPVSGVAPYTFVWKDSLGITLPDVIATITGVCAAVYSVFITDSAGDTVTVAVTAREPDILSTSFAVTNAACSFCPDGKATVLAAGGSVPYTYQWNDPLAHTGKTASGLDSGNHQVTITDVNGCTRVDSVLVGVNTATGLGLAFISNTAPLCTGDCSGSIEVGAYAGVPPYSYVWSDSLSQTTAMLTNLCAGTFTVTVTDNNSDSLVDSVNLTEPLAMTYSISTSADSGNSEGTASIVVTNGAAPISYTWNDAQAQTSATATGLSEGGYSVSWIDANGCTGSATDSVGLFISIGDVMPAAVSVFPNPSSGTIYLRADIPLDRLYINIANVLGQTIYSGHPEPGSEIDLSSYRSGLYNLTVQNGEDVILREKLILR